MSKITPTSVARNVEAVPQELSPEAGGSHLPPGSPIRLETPPDAREVTVTLIEHEGGEPAEQPEKVDPERSIGALLVDSGKITMAQAEKVLELQKRLGIRFGEAAVRLKVVTDDDLRFMLARQHGYDYLRKGMSTVSQEVRAAYEPYGAQAEVLRALRTQLMLRWFNGQPQQKMLTIVSPEAHEGRSHVTANLAVVFSQLGQRTLVVDCDLRRPRQHDIFGVDNQQGLSSVLSERTSVVSVKQVSALANLSVLTSGPVPPNPLELLSRETFPMLVSELCRNFDVVLCDTPNASAFADAQSVAVRSGGALMVLRKNATRVAKASKLSDSLEAIGVVLVGAVVNHR